MSIGTWKVKTLLQPGKLQELVDEIEKQNWKLLQYKKSDGAVREI